MSEINRRHTLQAFGMALLVEAAIVTGAAVILVGAITVKKVMSEPVPITLVTEEPEKPAPEIPPPPVSQPKVKQVKQVQPKLQPQLPLPQQQEALPITPEPALVPAAATAFSPPAPTPPPPAPQGKVDPALEYAAKVRAAVQAAHSYPAAAAAIHFSGRVRVEFHLRDGVPGQEHVTVPCGVGFIDHMALQAVQAAHYPEPPAELRGHDEVYLVWVEFNQTTR
ncbi:MAG: hypothetical protein JO269_13345 [Burkholderiaceae bacterium]|nr:hypothetical protein [Burkholderiaceae bacterium]